MAPSVSVLFALMLLSWASSQVWKDPSPHIVHLVEVEPGVRVEVLDWGGSGERYILLAGHGDTAHVFDDFAPRLSDDFHVSALTRRGFGASSQPAQGYDIATLVTDIVQGLEAMNLKRVHLVGHSIAGDEMTRFARMHPDRVGKMVYLEAAYDRVQARQLEAAFPKLPPPPEPTPSELASPAGVRAFVARTLIPMPESEIRATRVFHPDGRLLRPVTPDRILAAVASIVEHPDYESVRGPTLAIYAVPETPVQLIPGYKTRYAAGNRETRRVLDRIFDIWKPAAKAQRDQVRKAVPHARVVELHGASHYVFISDQQRVLREMKAFLRTR